MPQMQQSLSHDGKLFCITTNHIEPTCMYTVKQIFFNMDIKRPELSVHIATVLLQYGHSGGATWLERRI